MISLLMEEKERSENEELFRTYVAQALWGIDFMLGQRLGYEHDMPQYVELIHPEVKKKPLSADEIIQRTLKLFEVG